MNSDKRITRKSYAKNTKYYILFDLDETIGHFQDISIFLDEEAMLNPRLSKKEIIFKLLKGNSHVFRTKIFSLFNFIKKRKMRNNNIHVSLFTNNQGPKYWYNSIVEYINYTLNYKLFDKVIGPYKIGNTQIELQRTSHDKSIHDITRILNVSLKKSRFIIFDDQVHSNMFHDNVQYIHVNEYLPNIKSRIYLDEYKFMKDELIKFLPKSKRTPNKNSKTQKRKYTNNDALFL